MKIENSLVNDYLIRPPFKGKFTTLRDWFLWNSLVIWHLMIVTAKNRF